MSESDSKEQAPSAVLSPKPFRAKIDEVVYELKRETTGGEYLQIKEGAVLNKDGVIRLDASRYEHANLLVRLTCDGTPLTEEELYALPRTHYQTLSTLATQLDNEESGVVSDFLSPLLKEFPSFRSALEKRLGSRPSGSEPTSKLDNGGKSE